MIRSVLLALDSTAASQSALTATIEFCKRYVESSADAEPIHLTGIAVVDSPTIQRPMAAPIGGSSFKKDRDEALMADAKLKTESILSEFEYKCKEANLPHTGVRSEGLPYEQIEKEARTHDLIMIGRDTNFHYETSNSVGETVRKLLHDNARPVMVCTDQIPEIRKVVITYDGSIPSSHALHMWTLLGLRSAETRVHVVSVSKDLAKAESRVKEAQAMLKFHHIESEGHAVKRTGSVVAALQAKINEIDPRVVVMGAYGQGGLKETFFGSSTNKMLEETKCPLFLYK
ncbi:MAG: hypothetical protein COA78_20930 [Blastopirellula sp.]|nr:MAG: hypothetical protein COA78_20930 [Blastopirellula sp.]